MKGDKIKSYFGWKRFAIVIAIVFLVWLVWFIFFSYEDCGNSWDCFNKNLEGCDRTKFIGGDEMIFEYIIKGKSGDECKVDVELLQGELNNQDSIKLEKQKMSCFLPLGVLMIPESNIGNCHGMLKEGLQDLLIKKLHVYLVQNLGKLNLELLDVNEIV